MRLTVPGNLLLLGEYAVTEEGGLGLALAVDRRVIVDVQPCPNLVVEGRWGEEEVQWTSETPESSPLINGIVETWREQLHARGFCLPEEEGPKRSARLDPAARIVVDSSAFFTDRRKGGFGSSAAVTVALTCTLLHLSGFSGSKLLQCAARLALLAHRCVQGGRGSGYDVYASLYGGFGCLVGGTEPSWQAVQLPWLPPLYLFAGPARVSTPISLQHYERWKGCDPAGWRSFLERSNQAVRRFLQAGNWRQARAAFTASKELGLQLGERIGVSAAIQTPVPLSPDLCKALGAGNELGIYVAETPPEAGQPEARSQAQPALEARPQAQPALEAVVPSLEGVQWYF
jgi:phosphomevalonate kinase